MITKKQDFPPPIANPWYGDENPMPNRVKDPYAVEPRRLPSGRWKGRVVRYDSDTGKRHELTQTFDTKREAKQWAETEAAKYREDPNRKPPSAETFASFFKKWLDTTAAGRVRDTTLLTYQRYAAPLLATMGSRPLKSLTPGDFRGLYADMLKAGKATSTVHHTHVVAHSALDEAVNSGLIPFNPTDRVKPPRVVSPEFVPPTVEESQDLLAAAETDRLKGLWWFVALTGCRRGEAIALKWTDIDRGQRTALIQRTAAEFNMLLTVHDTKTAKGRRTIALSPYLLNILDEHRERQQLEREFFGSEWNREGWVFPSERGNMFWPTNVSALWRRLRDRAGMGRTIRLHDLRHAMATAWLIAGVPVKVVSERLGHASISITLQIYGHVLRNMQHDAAEQMDATFLETGRRWAAEDSQNASELATTRPDIP